MQALFVQQEAVKNLHESLQIPNTEDAPIEKIRHIRIDTAGHPTNRGNKKAFNFISRSTLTSDSFQWLSFVRTNSGNTELESKFEDIKVLDLIATQKDVFLVVLNKVIETLQKEEIEHRKKFAGKKLTDVFQNTGYPFEKVFEAILNSDSHHAILVESYVDQILKSVEAFKTGLKERGEPDDGITDLYEKIDYAFQHIKAFFHTSEDTHIQGEDTYIFADFARRQVQELKNIAQEIDERYSDIDNIGMP